MITFKQPEDLSKLSPTDPSYPLIKELIEELISAYTWEGHPYNPDWYGYTILIQESDADRELDDLWDGCRLTNIYWEGITLRDGFFIAIWLANNEYGLCFVIPDAPWLTNDLRRMIKDHLDPLPIDTQEVTT